MENFSKIKKIIIIFTVCLAVFIIFDFSYFSGIANFFARRPKLTATTVPNNDILAPIKIQPNILVINSLGITAPIQYATATGETAFQAALVNGPTHYPGTANPGQLGNCYIFGHSSDYIWSKGHYKHVFAALPEIQKGAEITISDSQGNAFTYLVIDSREVSATDLSVLSQQGYTKKLLTLQTSYPVGTALARWVVVAEIKNP